MDADFLMDVTYLRPPIQEPMERNLAIVVPTDRVQTYEET